MKNEKQSLSLVRTLKKKGNDHPLENSVESRFENQEEDGLHNQSGSEADRLGEHQLITLDLSQQAWRSLFWGCTDGVLDSSPSGRGGSDFQVARGVGVEDLDLVSLNRFRALMKNQFPVQTFTTYPDEEFLSYVGAGKRNRQTGEFELFLGTVLFLGRTNVIRELFPYFHLDYCEYEDASYPQCKFRISDNDYLQEEINLLSFFEKVIQRIESVVAETALSKEGEPEIKKAGVFPTEERHTPEEGQPDGFCPDSILFALREALVNTLVHADYQSLVGSVQIDVRDGNLSFKNPGSMRILPETFFAGGHSYPCNEVLMKLFTAAGLARRQGYGGARIFSGSLVRKYERPSIRISPIATELVFSF